MGPLENPVAEAQRILETSEGSKLCLRLVGGVGFYFRCASAAAESLRRRYVDIDFVGLSKQSRSIEKLFANLGYSARERFNLMQGDKRLIFNDLEHQRRVDIFLDTFEMSHKFNLKKRLDIEKYTLSLADLLATKLQVFEVNDKDLRDMLCMFIDHPIGKEDGNEMVNGAYLASLCGDDWGVYKTFTQNLDKINKIMTVSGVTAEQRSTAEERVSQLRKMIEDAPKSFKWKMRARVGESVRWYELPENDKEVVDSQAVLRNVAQNQPDTGQR